MNYLEQEKKENHGIGKGDIFMERYLKKHLKTFFLCLVLGILFICSIPTEAANSDFEIKDKVLVKYTGKGGQVTVPDGVETIGSLAFGDCRKLKTVVVPDSVETIGDSAFEGCTALEEVKMPANLKSVGRGAFRGCTGLKNVAFPKTVQTIGDSAFADCSSLTTVTLPDNLQDVSGVAFTNTPWMTELESASQDGMIVINGALFHVDENTAASAIPDGVHTICPGAFAGSQCLTELVIPDTVKSIGSNAFVNSSLSAITLPDTITTVKTMTFSGCSKLTSVKLPEKLKYMESYAFESCSALTKIIIPGTVTKIGVGAFRGSGLKKIVFPKSVQYISQDALCECKNLTKVTIKNRKANINNVSNTYDADGGIQTGIGTIFGPTIYAGEGIPLTNWSSFQTVTIEGYRYSTAQQLASYIAPLHNMLGFGKVQFKALDSKTSTLDKVKVSKSFTMEEKEKCTIKVTLPKGLKKVNKFTKENGQVKVTYQSSDEMVLKVSNKGVVTLKTSNYSYPLYIYTTLTLPNGNRKVYSTKIVLANRVALDKVTVTKSLTLSKGEKGTIKVTLPKTLKKVSKFTKKSGQVKITYSTSDKTAVTVNSKGVVTLNDDSMSDKPLYVYTILTQTDGNSEVIKTKIIIAK